VKASPSRMQIFNEIAQQLRVPSKKGLVLDILTRWNSTFDMLQSTLTYKEVFARYADSQHYITAPSVDDWNKTEEIYKFFKVFKETTNLFYGSKYPTSHAYFSKVWGIQDMLMEEANSQDETIAS
ncbi:hypothetical protein AMTR_s00086p00057580, partial [Amborella trichopoda]